MKSFIQKSPSHQGFTIAELMIATSVFSVILLVALAGFLDIGHLFYKGVNTTQTNSSATQILNEIVGNFQAASFVSPAESDHGYSFYCVGGIRYTYNLDNQVTPTSQSNPNYSDPSHGGNYGILRDTLPGAGGACATPCAAVAPTACPAGSASGAVAFQSPQEMLGNGLRVDGFSVSPSSGVGPNFYNVSIIIAYGDSTVLQYDTNHDPSSVYCPTGAGSGGQFCSVTNLSTSVYKGNP